MKSRFRLTTDAVRRVPSEQVIPGRSLNVTCFADDTFQDCARPVASFPGPVTLRSVSYANESTVRAAPSSVSCGSRLPGSVETAIVSVPDGAGALDSPGVAVLPDAPPASSPATARAAITPENLRISNLRMKFGSVPAVRLRAGLPRRPSLLATPRAAS